MKPPSIIFSILLVAMALISRGASAADVWTCTYPSFPEKRPVIARYHENSGFLIDDDSKQKYQILQNNQYGVIAVWSSAGQSDSRVVITAATIEINKTNGDFLLENANIAESDAINRPYHGKCLKD